MPITALQGEETGGLLFVQEAKGCAFQQVSVQKLVVCGAECVPVVAREEMCTVSELDCSGRNRKKADSASYGWA